MFPFENFICRQDPVRTSDVFSGGSDMTRHDVAMSLARHTHTRHMYIHQIKGLSGFSALI